MGRLREPKRHAKFPEIHLAAGTKLSYNGRVEARKNALYFTTRKSLAWEPRAACVFLP